MQSQLYFAQLQSACLHNLKTLDKYCLALFFNNWLAYWAFDPERVTAWLATLEMAASKYDWLAWPLAEPGVAAKFIKCPSVGYRY